MRMREIIRDKKRAARLDIELDAAALQRCIDSCQCPFCNDGAVYSILPLHIYQMHGITAYQLRQEYGWTRGHKLSSPETRDRMRQKAARPERVRVFLSHPNHGNMATRYADGGVRQEDLNTHRRVANMPEARHRFTESMAKVDRGAVARRVPVAVRKARSRRGARAFWDRIPLEKRGAIMANLRALRTPESEKRRIERATRTMNRRYRTDPVWREYWLARTREGIRKREERKHQRG